MCVNDEKSSFYLDPFDVSNLMRSTDFVNFELQAAT